MTNLYCHTKWKDFIPEVFATIEREGLREEIKTFGGCFEVNGVRHAY